MISVLLERCPPLPDPPPMAMLLNLMSTLCGMGAMGTKLTSNLPLPRSRIECLMSWPAAFRLTERAPLPALVVSMMKLLFSPEEEKNQVANRENVQGRKLF